MSCKQASMLVGGSGMDKSAWEIVKVKKRAHTAKTQKVGKNEKSTIQYNAIHYNTLKLTVPQHTNITGQQLDLERTP